MENSPAFTPEELEKMLEKAKRDAQAMLEKMTPEQRAQAESKARDLIREDNEAMRRLMDEAAEALGGSPGNKTPKFCGNCGAAAGSGKFCEYCGMPL